MLVQNLGEALTSLNTICKKPGTRKLLVVVYPQQKLHNQPSFDNHTIALDHIITTRNQEDANIATMLNQGFLRTVLRKEGLHVAISGTMCCTLRLVPAILHARRRTIHSLPLNAMQCNRYPHSSSSAVWGSFELQCLA